MKELYALDDEFKEIHESCMRGPFDSVVHLINFICMMDSCLGRINFVSLNLRFVNCW